MNFLELCKTRFSCRSYEETPVEDEKIMRCIEAAGLAPSAKNSQPWHFVVVTDQKRRQLCASACESKLGKMNLWVKRAPVIIALVTANENISMQLKIGAMIQQKHYYMFDQGMAAEHLSLQATEEGLGSCIIGWFNERKVRKALKVPRGKKITLMLTLGYPKRKTAPKKVRNELNSIISKETYGS